MCGAHCVLSAVGAVTQRGRCTVPRRPAKVHTLLTVARGRGYVRGVGRDASKGIPAVLLVEGPVLSAQVSRRVQSKGESWQKRGGRAHGRRPSLARQTQQSGGPTHQHLLAANAAAAAWPNGPAKPKGTSGKEAATGGRPQARGGAAAVKLFQMPGAMEEANNRKGKGPGAGGEGARPSFLKEGRPGAAP